MSNIIDKIQLSGVTYDIGGSGSVSTAITSGDTNAVAGGAVYDRFDEVEQVTAAALNYLNEHGGGGGGNPTVELTQAEYDALVSAGTVSADTYYIITDAQAGDLTQYWTSAQTSSAIAQAVSGKVDTSTYTAYTAATDSRIGGVESEVSSKVDKIYLDNRYEDGVKIEYYGSNGGQYIGHLTLFDVGSGLTMEFSGNTWVLSSTGGSGTASSAITSGDTNAVAGGAVYDKFDEVEQVTAQALNVLNDRLDEDEEVTAAALNVLNESLSGKQDTLSAGTNITIVDNVISAEGGGVDVVQTTGTSTTDVMSQDAVTTQLNNKASKSQAVGSYSFGETSGAPYIKLKKVDTAQSLNEIYYPKINGKGILTSNKTFAQNNYNFQLVETSAITTSVTSASTDTQIPSAKAVYDAIQEGGGGGAVSSAITSGDTNAVAGGAVYDKFDEVEQVTAEALNVLNEALSGKADSSAVYLKSETSGATELATAFAATQPKLSAGTGISIDANNVISATGGGGGGGTVESAITSGSTNAVESKAIWSATTYNKDVLLTFNGRDTTNYPQGCTKIKVEDITNYSTNTIYFNDDSGTLWSNITIGNMGSISVDTSNFQGATYEIDGSTVIISYPSVTTVTKLNVGENARYTYKAVVEGVWVADNTYMIQEVDTIVSGLQTNINSKLDATAYTPVNVDSALNVASTNPVENQALYSELRIGSGGETETTLTFEGVDSTNYPNGCTKIKVEVVGNDNGSSIGFFGDWALGTIMIKNWGSISVDTSGFQGATYEISGTTVIISYPTVTNVTRIQVNAYSSNYTYKAVTTGAPTALKDQVVENTTALGGLSLVKLTQAQYDALANKDNSTLYVIVG